MAKTRKYDRETVDSIEWNVHAKKLTIGGAKVTIGFAHSPFFDKPSSDDEAKELIEALVESNVYTWSQVASGLYDIVLQQFSSILNVYNKAASGDSFDLTKAMTLYSADAVELLQTVGAEEMEKQLRVKWTADNQGDVSGWLASEHQLFPSNVR